MLKKCISTCLVLCATATALFAQSNPTNYIRTDMISNSPTATSIAKQGAANINMATGAVNLSLPIFTVQGNELSLPISLSYSYDGFKPTQTASWVGQGWSLSAGGVITRTIKGKIDGDSNVGFNYWDSNVKSMVYHDLGTVFVEDVNSQSFFNGITQGIYDTELDEYSFNFDGYSGKFVMHGDTAFVTPKQKLKITGDPNMGFLIVTENGTKYNFTAVETTVNKGAAGAGYTIPLYSSAYYLTSIENVTNTEQIALSYVSDGSVNQGGSLTQTYKKIEMAIDGPSVLFPMSPIYPTKVTTLRLSQISSDKYVVNFQAGTANRIDLLSDSPNSKLLERIEISTKAGLPLKTFKLGLGVNDLMLKSLTEYGSNYPDTLTTPGQKHVFEYHGGGFLSNRPLAAVDHFGYALGGYFGSSSIPNTIYSGGVDRSPNFENTLVGALKKVTYPTGGNTEFEYEQNVKSEGAGYQGIPMDKSVSIVRTSSDPVNSTMTSLGVSFTIDYAQDVSVALARFPKSVWADGHSRNEANDFELLSSLGTVLLTGKIESEDNNFGQTFGPVSLPAGTYSLRVIIDSREDRMGASALYTRRNPIPYQGNLAGGIRLKKVLNKPVMGMPTQTTYSYVDQRGFSTGVGASDTYMNYDYYEEIYGAESYYKRIDSKMYTSMVAENSVNSNPHYYTLVTEMQTGNADTIMTKNWFDFKGPAFGTRPTKTIQYKKSGFQFVPVAKKEYDYYQAYYRAFRNMKAQQDWKRINQGGTYSPFPMEHYKPDNNEAFAIEQLFTKGIREVSYEGTDSLVKTTRYDYDIAGTTNLLRERVIKPDGEQLLTKYKYPENYTSAINSQFVNANVVGPAWEIQTWRKKGADSVLVGASFSEYDPLSFKPIKQYSLTAKGIVALNAETQTSNLYNSLLSDSRFEERASYAYSAKGRTISQQLKDGPATSYKWGYGNQQNYPVAEVKNAQPTEFYFENFEDSGTVGGAHSGTRYYSGDFAVSWAIPNGRSYVISYWYLDGTWKYAEQAYTGSTTLTLGSAIDDVAIFPKDAQLSHYAYIPGVGISASTDAKGLSTSYVYDSFTRLQDVKDQDGNIVKHYDYNITPNITGGTTYGNVTKSGSYTKNNCTSGTGTIVNYVVAAGTYYSNVSQADADAMAQADVTDNGQNYANANGTCSTSGPNSLSYSLPAGDSFNISIYNLGNGQTYNYTVSGDGMIRGIPNGAFDITVTSVNGYWYNMALDSYSDFGYSITFGNVTISGRPFPFLLVY